MNAVAAAGVLTAEPTTAALFFASKLMTFEEWANMDEDKPGKE